MTAHVPVLINGVDDRQGDHSSEERRTSLVTVGSRKAQPFLPMLAWLFGQLAGVLQCTVLCF